MCEGERNPGARMRTAARGRIRAITPTGIPRFAGSRLARLHTVVQLVAGPRGGRHGSTAEPVRPEITMLYSDVPDLALFVSFVTLNHD